VDVALFRSAAIKDVKKFKMSKDHSDDEDDDGKSGGGKDDDEKYWRRRQPAGKLMLFAFIRSLPSHTNA